MPFHAQKSSREPLKPGLSVPATVAALPKTQRELEALLRAERARLHVETHPPLQADIAARVETEVARRVEIEVAHQVQAEVDRRVAAEVDRRVAIEVAVQVQKLLEEIRLARHKMFAASSEANRGQGWLFNEVEAIIGASADDDDQDDGDDQSSTASRPAPAVRIVGTSTDVRV